MKMKSSKKLLSYILCIVLIVAMALFANGCSGSSEQSASSGAEASVGSTETDGESGTDSEAADNAEEVDNTDAAAGENVLGEGNTKFAFTVTDKDGNETAFEIHTDKEIVGEALMELGLIEGDESEFGLYVKTVNGITADYDTDGVYWAFYVNGEYAQSGVDSTAVTEGDTYSFKVE